MVASTGWSWDEVEAQMTWPRFSALAREWRRRPPVHWLAARFLDYKPPREDAPEAAPQPGQSLDALRWMFPGGVIR